MTQFLHLKECPQGFTPVLEQYGRGSTPTYFRLQTEPGSTVTGPDRDQGVLSRRSWSRRKRPDRKSLTPVGLRV